MASPSSFAKFLSLGKEHGLFLGGALAAVGSLMGVAACVAGFKAVLVADLQKERELREKGEQHLERLVEITVRAELRKISNAKEYTGHSVSRPPQDSSSRDGG
jgi:hypothetical protein